MLTRSRRAAVAGFSMIEILVAIVIAAFGLLGLAALMMRMQSAELESYQRGQALVLLKDMVERMQSNHVNAASYVTTGTIGTGDSQPADCSLLAAGSAARDICDWSNALKGSGETSGGSKVGAMVGARGCITLIQAANPAAGVCLPGIYEVAIAWQGVAPTSAPAVSCGQNLYGADTYRRVVSNRVAVGLLQCLPS